MESNNQWKLTSTKRLQFALAAQAAYRLLEETNTTTTYQSFLEIIGLKTKGEPWHISYRSRYNEIVAVLAAVEKKAGEKGSAFDRVVDARTGKPGKGYYTKDTKLVCFKTAA